MRVVAIWDEGPGAGAFVNSLDDEFQAHLAELVAAFGPPSRVEFRATDEGWEGTPPPEGEQECRLLFERVYACGDCTAFETEGWYCGKTGSACPPNLEVSERVCDDCPLPKMKVEA